MIYNLVRISDRCVKLKWEIEVYAKNDNGDIPKKNDNWIDCFSYLNANSHYKLLEVLEIIQEVKTEDPRDISLE